MARRKGNYEFVNCVKCGQIQAEHIIFSIFEKIFEQLLHKYGLYKQG